ncbi:hypothetical protein BDV25DRAFT_137249 [Aspergillus avenaceus]|uniref:EF-hand domain-containing protein n=1 Tax=Aspergillus avenaceus TaxID=36643 RepID=A0A5N6U3K3_ASPAV|nr:hypothetical protein BDV25DRAFT_137249 [Aspergillus avenaceus]
MDRTALAQKYRNASNAATYDKVVDDFDKADRDHDGNVTFQEYKNVAYDAGERYAPGEEGVIEKYWLLKDKNNDQKISLEEMLEFEFNPNEEEVARFFDELDAQE